MLALLLPLLVMAVYWPGLSGPLVFDDFPNLVRNPYIRIESLDARSLAEAARSSRSGPLGRPLAMTSFALNHYFSGGRLDPFALKLTNALIHGLNAMLVFVLSLLVLRRLDERAAPGLRAPVLPSPAPGAGNGQAMVAPALLVALLWALHPLQLTAVLYAVQRMTSLAALAVLGGLVLFACGRARLEERPGQALALMSLGVGGGTALGLLAKENAVLLPLLAGLLEWCCHDRRTLPGRQRTLLGLWWAVFLGLPVLAGLAVLALEPARVREWLLGGYAGREFGMGERLLTEARVLFYYLRLLFLPSSAELALYHDDFPASSGWLDPPTTLLAVAGWGILVGLAVRASLRGARPVWALALLWYLSAHLLESSILPLELVFEHRNYLPLLGPVLAGVWYARLAIRSARPGPAGGVERAGVALALVAVTAAGGITAVRASLWSDADRLVAHWARRHPDSERALLEHARRLIVRAAPLGEVYRAHARLAALAPGRVGPRIELVKMLTGLGLALEGPGFRKRLPVPIPRRTSGGEPTPGGAVRAPAAPAAGGAMRAAPDPRPPRAPFPGAMPRSPEAIAREVARLDGEIRARLARGALRVPDQNALLELQGCIRQGVPFCAPLEGLAMAWHETALAAPRMSGRMRASLLLSSARLAYFRGDVEQASARARQAWELDRGDIGYGLELARLLALLGKPGEARELVEVLVRRVGNGGFRAREVENLRAELARDNGAVQ